MNIPSILRRVYREPWLITAEAHDAIRCALDRWSPSAAMPQQKTDPDSFAYRAGNVAVIPIYGVLGRHLGMLEIQCGGCSVDDISSDIQEAVADSQIKSILLDIDSPGGTVIGTPETAALIAEADAIKPVYAFTEGTCASGALWLASQARTMFCTPSSRVGSVGVYAVYIDESRRLANEGTTVNAISAGEHKLMGAPWKPMTDDERAILQADVDKVYGQFKAAVKSRRDVDDECLTGLVYDGEAAALKGFCNGGTVSGISEVITLITNQG